ncbi:hypothetical protein AGABI2DRAFT_150975 [Agaricus bisporus var. bisporus H97]|uniref:hypothetical protein n=1 Tax=Agaricus bisporus var. bisporus (strain H97 / ATCC MYA-4626 / FGSC 10389) TaxID=936046 RepID=UPI00029F6D47|nr:hypothetical protein AGABI2DRAFT_150975 [Agaricus bisporus var. bisporus H97]EKV47536.1 hypothetical protein AGABI2DRAFT_150975 [Agaricus bisporus var. bisporus H97]
MSTLSQMTLWPSVQQNILLADATAIKDLATVRRFPKPVQIYEAINIYGRNILSTDGELWKKYRRISAPSFSEKNNRLVWAETLRIVDDLVDNIWNNTDATIAHGVDITLPLALLVIGTAGFGQTVSWEDNANAKSKNHLLTFREALHTTASNLVYNSVFPDWVKSLHPGLRKVLLAKNELELYMREMIRDRLSSDVRDKHDLFSSLIYANKEELGGASLSEEELMGLCALTFLLPQCSMLKDLAGNIFIFLVAGHETTAHTLSFTFALLALYPEVQEKMLKHIRSVIPDGRRPAYEDMPNLTYIMAIYNETIRLFPPASAITKFAPEDTSITVGNCYSDEQRRIPVPKGTKLTIDIAAVQRNPKYWEKPNEFIPERFLGDYNKDAFVAFSVGPRACLGRKFNETEGVAALTSIVSRYKIEIQDEPQFKYESFEQRRERILTTQVTLTLAPKRLPLVFRRRAN